jgi:hypothetical protein
MSLLWKGGKFVGSGLAFLVTVVTLYPRVTITVAGPSDDKAPLSALFTVSNDGYLPATKVSAMCTSARLSVGRPLAEDGQQMALGPGWNVSELSPGEKMGIPLSNCFIVPTESLTDASIGLLVTYRPYFLPFWERHTTSVFQVRNIGAGHFYWYSSPK